MSHLLDKMILQELKEQYPFDGVDYKAHLLKRAALAGLIKMEIEKDEDKDDNDLIDLVVKQCVQKIVNKEKGFINNFKSISPKYLYD